MPYTKLSTKGQVILPKEVREQLRLKEGTEFAVRASRGAVILEPVGKRDWRRLRGLLAGTNVLEDLEREHRDEIESDARRS